ncbi:MAG: protease HtpX [Candidatus Levybacteria bacterium RIFCSPHIGHO2_01_FULL_38_26]|nr:MAG: protease HtpX [Candidatus Levybacteria bacterium RIFCSPHIGHO2_01_FULL_38_26]
MNTVKTIALLGVLSVLLITVGGLLGGQEGIYMAFFFSLLMNGAAYFFSDKLALKMSGAKPIKKRDYPQLFEIVEDLSRKMKIPMPKMYITPAAQANAFATGRDPSHASVAVTKGIMNILSKEELKGVLAHELSHVKNRDILVASVAAVIASAISFLANMSLFGAFSRGDNRGGAGAFGLLIAILVPIAASIIQLAISRQREYGADETGARLIGNGEPLARALIAIHDSTRRAPLATNPAYSSLYISNPLGGLGGGLTKLFSTHPPVEERVKRLRNIK